MPNDKTYVEKMKTELINSYIMVAVRIFNHTAIYASSLCAVVVVISIVVILDNIDISKYGG